MEAFVGMIAMFAFNRIPNGWVPCNGQMLPIAGNEPLFTLIGTTYGGNGQTSFGLPDLQGKLPIHKGRGLGLADRVLGQKAGSRTVTLTTAQLPQHNHTITAISGEGDTSAPAGAYLANAGALDKDYKATGGTLVQMHPATVGLSGLNQPFDIVQPTLTINFCISLFGVYPQQF